MDAQRNESAKTFANILSIQHYCLLQSRLQNMLEIVQKDKDSLCLKKLKT